MFPGSLGSPSSITRVSAIVARCKQLAVVPKCGYLHSLQISHDFDAGYRCWGEFLSFPTRLRSG